MLTTNRDVGTRLMVPVNAVTARDMERWGKITGRPVALVDASTVRNPYFGASAISTAQDLYAA